MPEEDNKYLRYLEATLQNEQQKNLDLSNQYGAVSSFLPTKDQNLVEYQLDLKEELNRIEHLLSGHELKRNEKGEYWGEPDDDRLKILSEHGVKAIMNIVSFYINRNTLLSNYDDETILWKMKDLGNELNDLILNRYEFFFSYPTPEQLYEQIKTRNIKTNLTDEELYNKCIQWSREELEYKTAHYPIIVMQLLDSVHSTYLRALNGEERDSLRKFMHVSQSNNIPNEQGQGGKAFSVFKPSSWGGK